MAARPGDPGNGVALRELPDSIRIDLAYAGSCTGGKREDLHAKRQVFSYITKETVAKKVIDETAPKYADRSGGYTRITKTGLRRGDAAPMAVIELL